jgi:transketolase
MMTINAFLAKYGTKGFALILTQALPSQNEEKNERSKARAQEIEREALQIIEELQQVMDHQNQLQKEKMHVRILDLQKNELFVWQDRAYEFLEIETYEDNTVKEVIAREVAYRNDGKWISSGFGGKSNFNPYCEVQRFQD